MAEGRRIAIAIAVARSVPRKYLPGAINGARAFQAWAAAQGYESALITDAKAPVTVRLLRENIEAILSASAAPIYRIILYFAGHGLIREIEEGLWLLSDWRVELRAVAVEVLKRRLTMYAPKQICIISDACRSLPSDITQADLVPDAVLGAGPQPVDMTVAIDKFIAAQDGAEAFMIPGDDAEDDRCLFSGVLLEGLWGKAGRTHTPFSMREPDKVTGRSLGAYLLAEAGARAKDYDLTLTPSVSATFPEGEDYYFLKEVGIQSPKFVPWPSKSDLSAMGLKRKKTAGSLLDRFKTIIGSRPVEDQAVLARGAPALPESTGVVEKLREQVIPELDAGVYSGLSVSEGETARLWLSANHDARQLTVGSWSIVQRGGPYVDKAAQVLIEFPDGLFASAVVLQYLFASLARDSHGVGGIMYRSLVMPSDKPIPTEEALAALESGALRSDAAADLAVRLREGKHADPVLGVISAYLYDAVGDVDNIRRMASFYAEYGEAIPYDIALLGGLKAIRTPTSFSVEIPEVPARKPRTQAESEQSWTYCHVRPGQGVVAGLWPWMRQGWSFLEDPSDVGSALILPGLVEARSGLMRSRFTTLENDAALVLARVFNLRPAAL